MELTVVPFEERFVTAAAALLVAGHAAAGAAVGAAVGGAAAGAVPGASAGAVPGAAAVPGLRDVETARRAVTAWQHTGPAVAALEDGTLVGFLAATHPGTAARPDPAPDPATVLHPVTATDSAAPVASAAPGGSGGPGGRLAAIRLQQHAAVPGAARAIYRRLYAALSGRLTAAGAFEHAVQVSTGQPEVVTCFFELGFGIDMIKGMRNPTVPTRAGAAAPDVRLRPARADDLPELLRLVLELRDFHAGPPMHRPALVDLPAAEAGFRAALGDDRHLLLVAEEQDRPGSLTGVIQADPDHQHADAATIEIAVVTAAARFRGVGGALLRSVLAWAARTGRTACGVGWTSANPVSDAFWRGHGFVPVQYRLTRLLDADAARRPAGSPAR